MECKLWFGLMIIALSLIVIDNGRVLATMPKVLFYPHLFYSIIELFLEFDKLAMHQHAIKKDHK